MKFCDLAIGQPFRLGDLAYIKTGPLAATTVEGGARRCIARSEPVRVEVDRETPSHAARVETLDAEAVRAAIERLHDEAQRLLGHSGAAASRRAALHACRVLVLQRLGLSDT